MSWTCHVDQDVVCKQRYLVFSMYTIILPDQLTQRLYKECKQQGTDGTPLVTATL